MSAPRKPKALIDAEKKIAELTEKLAQTEKQQQSWYAVYQEEKKMTDGLHDVLTDLGVREFRDEQKYQRLPLAVRLFAWAMSLAATKGEVKNG
jgi:hypothetical protein